MTDCDMTLDDWAKEEGYTDYGSMMADKSSSALPACSIAPHPDWDADYTKIWTDLHQMQERLSHYRRALYFVCDGDKQKARDAMRSTEQ